jgi:site-specific DNA recombinase
MSRPVVALLEPEAATAVVYLRVSSSGQVNRGTDPEGYSIPGQREATKAKAEGLSAAVIAEFVEYGVSGRTTHRPALQRMLAALPKLRPTYVIVYDLSRLARNRLDDALLMLQIEQSGARLVSVLENVDQTPSGRLTHGVLAAVNEFRSAGDAEKVKMGLQRKHAMGGTSGMARVGYLNVRKRVLGRDVRTVELDPDRAPLVRMGFETYATSEYSLSALTELLDVAGLRLPMSAKRPARPMARSAVYRMLRDDYYIGVVTLKGVKNPNGLHPALIDVETFERVQAVLQAHALSGDRSRKYEHYLKGSIHCGVCGSRLLFMRAKGNGGTYEYFGCQGRRLRRGVTCYGPYMPVDDVERAVERYYQRHVGLSPAAQERIRARVHHYAEQKLKAARHEAERASRRLDALKQEQQRLLQLSYQDLVDTDVLAAEQARIKAQRAQLEKWAKAIAHNEQDIKTALEEALRLLDHAGAAYQQATPTIRRMLNQAIFEQLHILDGEVTQATRVPLIQALESLGCPRQVPRRFQAPGQSLRAAIRAEQEARTNHGLHPGGRGLHNDQLVLLGGQLYSPSSALERVLAAPAPKQRAIPKVATLPQPGRLGNGVVLRAVVKVLAAADGSMRGTDVHKAVEHVLGHPVSKNSVDWCLAANVKGDTPRFERVSDGVYRLAAR